VEVHSDDAIQAACSDQVSDDASTYGLAPPSSAILPGISEVWNHRRQTGRPGTPTGIGHKKEFEQMLVYGRASRLDEIDVVSAHTFLEFDV
jgi:hypothetical protein